MGSQIAQVLQNITIWGRYMGEGLVGIIALALIVHAFGRGQGSLTRVVIIAGCAMVAAALVWQLPDLLKLATSDAPSITGVGNSRY